MIYFFILSVCILLGLLALSLFSKKLGRLWAALLTLGAAAASATWLALVLRHFLGGRVEFLHPAAFLLCTLALAALLARISWKKQFTRPLHYPLAHLPVEQTSLRVLFTRWLPFCLYAAALVLMSAALARPVRVDRTVLPPTEGIDIILLMDASASMQKKDFYPNRFVAAQQTALRFIAKRPSDRIGLVVFSKQALLQAPLTLDHEALQEYIASLYLGMIDPNYTAIGDALGVAANHLKDSKAKSKVIILLTDGDSNAGTIEPLMAAQAAAAYGIRVYTIGTASAPDNNPYASQADEINEGLLLEIAQKTGGKFYRAKNESELEKIYDTINELEKTEFAPSTSINRTDAYQPLLWLALCFLLAGLAAEKIFFIKVP